MPSARRNQCPTCNGQKTITARQCCNCGPGGRKARDHSADDEFAANHNISQRTLSILGGRLRLEAMNRDARQALINSLAPSKLGQAIHGGLVRGGMSRQRRSFNQDILVPGAKRGYRELVHKMLRQRGLIKHAPRTHANVERLLNLPTFDEVNWRQQ